jgi:hypothetical protein
MKDKKCKPGKLIYTTMIQSYIAHGMDEAAKLLEMEVERFDNKLLVSASCIFWFIYAYIKLLIIPLSLFFGTRDQFLRLIANNFNHLFFWRIRATRLAQYEIGEEHVQMALGEWLEIPQQGVI